MAVLRHFAAAGGVMAIAVIAAAAALPAATADASPAYPVTPSLAAGIADAIPDPAAAPAGANVPSCHSTARPRHRQVPRLPRRISRARVTSSRPADSPAPVIPRRRGS
jgi:hypothetical protein